MAGLQKLFVVLCDRLVVMFGTFLPCVRRNTGLIESSYRSVSLEETYMFVFLCRDCSLFVVKSSFVMVS